MEKQRKNYFEIFDRHKERYLWLLIVLYLFINNTINATSDWMEATRNGSTPEFSIWEPFAWEYTSVIGTMLILPLALKIFSHFKPHMEKIGKQICIHLSFSLILSILHVTIMVLLRKAIYWVNDRQYDFGNTITEFFYEYRKDLWGYIFMLAIYTAYQFIYSRLKGEASLIDTEENFHNRVAPQHLIVRKLDQEFLVKVDDIEWLESAGNYVNLHSQGRVYPLRSTMAALLERIEQKGFSRIHRSFGVNHNFVSSINNLASGDAEITLNNGVSLTLSRRYKDAFKQKLS